MTTPAALILTAWLAPAVIFLVYLGAEYVQRAMKGNRNA
jgi:hypothetical protein